MRLWQGFWFRSYDSLPRFFFQFSSLLVVENVSLGIRAYCICFSVHKDRTLCYLGFYTWLIASLKPRHSFSNQCRYDLMQPPLLFSRKKTQAWFIFQLLKMSLSEAAQLQCIRLRWILPVDSVWISDTACVLSDLHCKWSVSHKFFLLSDHQSDRMVIALC